MALESATYISDLVSTNPTSSDNLSQGDDHLRLLKSTVKATFPNVSGAVLPTHTELNFVDGVTSSIQTQLDAKAAKASANTFTANQRIDAALGIGVAPSVAFDMAGEVLIRGAAAAGSVLRVTPDATGSNGVILDTSWITGSAGPLIFKMASTERMRVTAAGDVGIGTASPNEKFHIRSSGSVYAKIQCDNAGAGAGLYFTNTTTNWLIGSGPVSGAGELAFHDATRSVERMRIDSSGNVGIGATPTVKLEVGGTNSTTFFKNSGATTGYVFADIVNTGCTFRYGVATSGGSFWSTGSAGSYSGNIGTVSATALGFGTSDTLRMQIDSSGNILNVSSGGLGYGTGSGGTVTQITSKSTGVTINKTNGQIVTSNAAMAASAEITFTVTNSTVAATDTIVLHRASGGGSGSNGYVVYVDSVSAGSFTVYIKNISAVSRTDAITLNFAVLKAVTS